MAIEESLSAFRRDTDLVCRTLGCILGVRERASAENAVLDKLQKNGSFWTDYEHLALTTVIIGLGRIFDSQKNAHCVQRLQDEIKSDLKHFGKSALTARKRALTSNADDWLSKYIEGVHEFDANDLKAVSNEIGRAEALWKKCKPMRDRVFAHDQAQTRDARTKIFTAITYDDIIAVSQVLTNLANALFEAEQNGRQPQFGHDIEMAAMHHGRDVANTLIDQLG
ncbi:hypothetical protein [Mesorhizobium sp. M0060]|uniref:AbiU2 domain-containing protein n=1 Tax=Mesorhizobium sp. M0060 TaxID=2956866 RepID=UPI0033395D6F